MLLFFNYYHNTNALLTIFDFIFNFKHMWIQFELEFILFFGFYKLPHK